MSNQPPAYGFYRQFDAEPAKDVTFPYHYLLYASHGAIGLSTENNQWVLPPERAAWIQANEAITIELKSQATTCSLLFRPDFLKLPIEQCTVFTVTPLAQQMMLHCQQWGQDNAHWNAEAEHFFLSVAQLCLNLAAQQNSYWLPRGQSQAIKRAIQHSQAHLSTDLTIEQAAEQVHQSVRSFSRHLSNETGLNWRDLRLRQRMLYAVERLTTQNVSLTSLSFDVGYKSQSAFNKAFKQHTGQTPTQFRQQVNPD